MNRVFLVLPLIVLALLAAIGSGLERMGWTVQADRFAAVHSALMVGSFLSSLIFLERAVTLPSRLWLLLPAGNAASLLCFAAGQPQPAYLLLSAGAAGFLGLCLYFLYRYRELYYYVFVAGAVCLLAGNLSLLSGQAYGAAVPWWMGFLLLTIVAERLELSRFLQLTAGKRNLLLAALAIVLLALSWPFAAGGEVALAIGLTAVSAWLLRYDMARHAVRASGQHRYSALLLIVGYGWLLVTAALLVQAPLPFVYDALLHSFFIGFVFAMIFSHAPIILPAIARWPVKLYRPFLYVPFVLLQATLVLRLVGDSIGDAALRRAGGLGNAGSMLLFFGAIAVIVGQERRKRKG
ncbi:MAG TPA: hypothetical protein VHK69_12455 [Chitinophagaceae bacterium]|jgi:hypothetical protein|nr:hypothetical protein [Chitinophagaceae bacterium]